MRYPVKLTSHSVRSDKCRPGIQSILEVAGKERGRLVAFDLGFVVGPRLNAAG